MKRPLLKFLPGVAVVLITPSCSKDNDNIVEDNTALVAEQVIENQVFYLKINYASSLSKMTVEGLGESGKTALKFEQGDELTLTFNVEVFFDDSGHIASQIIVITTKAQCIDEDGTFAVSTNDLTIGYYNDGISEKDVKSAAQEALKAMQDGKAGAAMYNVQLSWGNPIDLTSAKFVGYDNLSGMFAAAPRSADRSFTLKQDGDYCFIVFEEGCTKTVTVDGKTLANVSEGETPKPMCYIVASGTEVKVTENKEGAETNSITTESGNLYYIRKKIDIYNPDAGNVKVVKW